MKLEVGKLYVNRRGEIWVCQGRNEGEDKDECPFICGPLDESEEDDTFREDGGFYPYLSDGKTAHDLLEEYKPPKPDTSPSTPFEVGRHYKAKCGAVLKVTATDSVATLSGQRQPVEALVVASTPPVFDEGDCEFFFADGRYVRQPTHRDLIPEPVDWPAKETKVTIEPGEEFTTSDSEKCAAAKELQESGVVFEYRYGCGRWHRRMSYGPFEDSFVIYRRQPETATETEEQADTQLMEISFVLSQDANCMETKDEYLQVKVHGSTGCDDSAFVTIKTEGWSFDIKDLPLSLKSRVLRVLGRER